MGVLKVYKLGEWISGGHCPKVFGHWNGKSRLQFGREIEQMIYYDGIDVILRRADFIVENQIIVEIKAVINLEDVHLAQAKNYVVAYDFPIGLLINFGCHIAI